MRAWLLAVLLMQAPAIERQAYRAYQQREWAEAARLYDLFHVDHAGTPSSYDNLGVARINLGQWAQAAQALGRAIELDPRHRWAYNHLGFVHREQGRHAEAIAMFRRQIEVSPKDPYAWRNLASTLALAGRLEEAERAAEEHEQRAYERGAVYIDMACSLHAQNRPEPARKYLERAEVAGAERALVAQEWAHYYLTARDYRRAEQQYLKLAEYRPYDPAVALRLGTLYFQTGNLEKAAAAFARAISVDDADQVTIRLSANSSKTVALEELRTPAVLGDLPVDLKQAALVVRLERRRGGPAFRAACQDLLAAAPPREAEAWARDGLGWSLWNEGREAEAQAELRKAFELSPRRMIAYHLAVAWERSDATQALELYIRSLDPLPEAAIDCECEQPGLAERERLARALFVRFYGPAADFESYRRSVR